MSEWMGRGTQSTPCVCGVSSAICVCVGGWVWGQERGERRQAWTAWEVGVVVRRQAQRHTSVRATTVRRCAQSHHQHTHTADRAGQRTQWWWLVGMAHSGGGSHTTHSHHHHVPHTPCVCVMGVDSTSTASECTKWSHCPQHPRCHHQHQQEEEEELVGGVGQKEWGWELVGGWGHTQARAWAHTSHQSVSGVVLSHGCVCGKRSALIHTTTSSSRRTRVDKDRKDKDWWDKKKEGVAPTPPHTTNKPESTMVVSQTTTPTQNHNKKKRKRKGEKGRWKQEEEREGQQAQGTVSVLVGCGTHVAQTTHHIHSTHRERETGKGKGQEKRQRKTKDKEWCMGVVVMEKQEASKLVTHHHFAPHFFPTPFFSLPPFFTPSLFPLLKTPHIMDYRIYFTKHTNTLLQTKLKLKEKTIQNERTQANLSASLFPDNSPTYNPLSLTPVVFWLSAYIFPEKSNYSFSHSYSIKPYKLSTNKQTQQPSCAITLHTFPSGCHLNT